MFYVYVINNGAAAMVKREAGRKQRQRHKGVRATRKQALENIKIAGIQNDQQAMIRIYTENRISYSAALAAWAQGCRIRIRGAQ